MNSLDVGLCDILEKCYYDEGGRLAYQFLENYDKISEALTYRDLLERASASARSLTELGLAGRHIALMAASSPEFVISFFAILWSGGIVVPLAPLRTSGSDKGQAALLKLERLLSVAQVSAVIADAAIAARLEASRDYCQTLRSTAIVDIVELCRPNQPADRRRHQATAVIQFTSGSTSDPKGVCVTHSNFIANSGTMARVFNATPDDAMLHWLPLYHDMGLIGGIVAPLCNRLPSTIIPATRFAAEPGYWPKAISHVGATMSTAPNFAFQLCAERMSDEEIAKLDLRRWRAAICGSEPIRAAALELFAKRFASAGFSPKAVFPTYGLAEATIYVSGGPIGSGMTSHKFDRAAIEHEATARPARPGHAARELVSCGRFPPEHDIAIVNPQCGSACSDGKIGEIWLRGPGVAAGYLCEAAVGPKVFERSVEPWGPGFLATGDLGFLQDGELYVVGRLRDLIILDGVNRFPQDIELAANGNDQALSGCINAAFQREDGSGGVVLLQEVPRRSPAEVQALLQAIRRRVADHEQIALAAIVAVARGSIPRTSSGKVARRQARGLWLSGALKVLATGDDPIVANQLSQRQGDQAVKGKIIALWQEALGHDGFGSETPFFEVGGTSLQLTGLHAALLRTFDIEFPLIELMEYPTIQAMTRLVEGILDPETVTSEFEEVLREQKTELVATERLARRIAARLGTPEQPAEVIAQ
jgi:acyl-CoA synthetase (AMP-forming)/AMP-acid ligase II/acyl carrier protein